MKFTNTPLVSVTVPSFNHEKFIQQCILSIVDQDYQNIELVIIDDGSTDNSRSKIEELLPICEARFVRFEFILQKNMGLSATLNVALNWSSGQYFSAIASDDLMYKTKTTVLVSQLEKTPEAAGAFSACNLIDSQNQLLQTYSVKPANYQFQDIILCKHQIHTPTQLLRTELVREAGGYIDDMFIEDWYMWLSLTKTGHSLVVVEDILGGYRQHGSNASKAADKMYHARKETLNRFRYSQFYDESVAHICLMTAVDFTSISKKKSFMLLLEGVRSSVKVCLSIYFYTTVLRILIPRSIIETIKPLIDRP